MPTDIPKQKLGRTPFLISRLGLGTAEIGFNYGIGKRELPSDKEAEMLLKSAIELGINYFDTASMYGLAEERLGKFGIAKLPGVVVGTKCGSFLDKGENLTSQEMESRIRAEVESSLKNLQLDSLPLVQLHGGSPEKIKEGNLISIIKKLKEEGKIQYTGISTRGEEVPIVAIESDFFDVIQVAYSILDQRMQKDIFPLAERHNIGIINRSVLLKGALTPLAVCLPKELELLKINSGKAEVIAKKYGMSLPTLAIRFAGSNKYISTSLIGTNNLEHLVSSAEAILQGPLEQEIISELETLGISDPEQVDPARWPKS